MHISDKSSNFAPSNKKNNSKTFKIMKKQTKMKIAAVAAVVAVLGLITLICSFILVLIGHPAQWVVGYISAFAMGAGLLTACTID